VTDSTTNAAPTRAATLSLRKVPEVTALFWITKVLTTGMGETTSDFFVKQFVPEIAVAVAGLVLVIALALQFRARRYIPVIYWFAVVMVSVFGTMAADVLHVQFGVPYVVSTALFAVVLTVVFVAWFLTERTLSIHSIVTRRREAFYWATVLTTFALGTAAGDLTATTLGLGYFTSGIVFLAVIAIPALAWRFLRLNAIFAFWFAYIVTRPLGASFADWMAVTPGRGGLNFGTGPVSLVLTVLIAGMVLLLSRQRARQV
jgi:uncharacterized membrane-anchored protein